MKNKILDILKSNVTESANDYNKIYEKDFDKLANELLAAISVTRCSTQFFCCKEAIEQRCAEQCLGCYTYKRD